MAWRLPSPKREALALAGLAAVLAALLLGLGPPGTDVAAHVFQRELYAAHGFCARASESSMLTPIVCP